MAGPYPGLQARAMVVDRVAPVGCPGLRLREPGDLRRVPLIHFDWRRSDPANPTRDA